MKNKFTFFWSGVFSNWFESKFEIQGETFNCVEQYMMYKKAMMFSDEEVAFAIMRTNNPREQKELGRKVRGFNKELWEQNCKQIVYDGARAKFTQNPGMLKSLMDTEGTELCEASPKDFIWGCGLHKTDNRILDKKNWPGTNWLGETLTKLREDLIKENLK